jgi:hypothetical protein
MKLKHALFYLHKPLLNVVGTFPAPYGPHRFNTVFTTAQQWTFGKCSVFERQVIGDSRK